MISQLTVQEDVNTGRHSNDDINRLELFWETEKTLIMHKLSKEYFGFRAFWFMFFPLLAITSLTTIIGFLTTGMAMEEGVEQIDDSGDGGFVSNIKGLAASVFSVTSQWLSLSVGILGAISTFLTSMGKHTNYQSKRDMHEMAGKSAFVLLLFYDVNLCIQYEVLVTWLFI